MFWVAILATASGQFSTTTDAAIWGGAIAWWGIWEVIEDAGEMAPRLLKRRGSIEIDINRKRKAKRSQHKQAPSTPAIAPPSLEDHPLFKEPGNGITDADAPAWGTDESRA
jgi:hypothetical protein